MERERGGPVDTLKDSGRAGDIEHERVIERDREVER